MWNKKQNKTKLSSSPISRLTLVRVNSAGEIAHCTNHSPQSPLVVFFGGSRCTCCDFIYQFKNNHARILTIYRFQGAILTTVFARRISGTSGGGLFGRFKVTFQKN